MSSFFKSFFGSSCHHFKFKKKFKQMNNGATECYSRNNFLGNKTNVALSIGFNAFVNNFFGSYIFQ